MYQEHPSLGSDSQKLDLSCSEVQSRLLGSRSLTVQPDRSKVSKIQRTNPPEHL